MNGRETNLNEIDTSEGCSHWRQRVELLDGVTVYASALRDRRLDSDVTPDETLHLDRRWGDPHFPWEDMGVPDDMTAFREAVLRALRSAEQGRVVEIGCLAGHGRTGTTLACLLVLQGMDASSAIDRIRREYCPRAVETDKQMDFVGTFERGR